MSRKTRKLMWSVPLIAAIAVIGALAAFMTLQPNGVAAQADTPPGQVMNLQAEAYENGVPEEQIELTWEKPTTGGRATHYRIDVSENGGYTWYSLEPNVRNTRYLHAHNPPSVVLQANEERHYRVFAINSFGVGSASPIISATTDMAVEPARPTNLTATAPVSALDTALTATDLIITVNWNAPLNPDGAPVIGYILEYSDDGEGWITLPNVKHNNAQTQQTFMHEELNAGVEYYYRVSAYNQTVGDDPDPAFVSGWSNTDSAVTSAGDMPPQFTINRTAVTPEAGGVWLYWDMPADFNPSMRPLGDEISGYVVQGRPTQALNDADPPALAACAVADCPFQAIKPEIDVPNGQYIHSFQVTPRDVEANTDYELEEGVVWAFRIRGLNRRAEDAADTVIGVDGTNWSTPVNATPGLTTAPLVPQGLSITRSEADNAGRTGLMLTWKKATSLPTDANPPVITDAATYRIEYSDTGPGGDGYNWRQLQATYTPSGDESPADAEQMFVDSANNTTLHPTAATKLAAGQVRHYRVFANIATVMGWASVPDSGTTATALEPGAPELLRAVPTGHTEVTLSWAPPSVTDTVCGGSEEAREDDGSECGPSVITKYIIEYSSDEGDTWGTLMMADSDGDLMAAAPAKRADETVTTRFSLVDKWELSPLQTRDYRVKVENKARHQSAWSNTATATTPESSPPNEPGGLVAEANGAASIKLCWNAQAEEPVDDPVAEYLIEYAASEDGPWMELARVTTMTEGEIHTVYEDNMGLTPGETRYYRVTAMNVQGPSDQSDVAMATTDDADAPGMPTALTATAVSDMQIDLNWTAPADPVGAPVTGNIIERAYGDVMFLDHEDAMGDAFTDAQTWWDGLGCEAMVAAVMDDGEANMDNPFCKMYADLDEASEMAVDEYFMKRYAVVGDVTSYEDTGLMEMTDYTYRVKAVNAKGAGEWSNTDMATTAASNMAPMDGPDLTATVTAGDTTMVQSTISDPDTGDTLTWATATTSSDATIATAMVDATTGMVTIMGHMAGMATITVTAMDAAGESAMQDIMVTVEDALTAPTNVRVNPAGSGIVLVDWDPVVGAAGFYIIATNLADTSDQRTEVINNPSATAGAVDGLTVGEEYLIFVYSFKSATEFMGSDYVRVTAE